MHAVFFLCHVQSLLMPICMALDQQSSRPDDVEIDRLRPSLRPTIYLGGLSPSGSSRL